MKSDDIIRKSKYFKELDNQDYFALQRCLKTRLLHFDSSSTIINQGDKALNCYIILTGKARSYNIDIDGNEKPICEYAKDSIFGLDYILRGTNLFKESLIALTDCNVLVVDGFKSTNLCQNRCKRHTSFIKLAFEDMAKQLSMVKNRNYQVTQSKTRDKIATYLSQKSRELKKTSFSIPYDRQELADYLGVERSALSDELSKMKKDGLIDYNKNYFQIVNKKELLKK